MTNRLILAMAVLGFAATPAFAHRAGHAPAHHQMTAKTTTSAAKN